MEKALYGLSGDYINLKTFIERQGSDASAWIITPYCKGCGAPVHPVDIKATLGFRQSSSALLSRKQEAGRNHPSGHFSHYDHNDPTCPYASNRDPFYDLFSGDGYDYRSKDLIKSALSTREIQSFNFDLYQKLYWNLSGTKPTVNQIFESHKKTEKHLSRMQILIENPWVYPFAQILLDGDRKVTHRKTFTLRFEPKGTKAFTIKDPYGVVRETTIPKKIELHFVKADGTTGSLFKQGGQTPIIYNLTQKSAENIVGRPLQQPAPKQKLTGFGLY